MEYVYVVEIEGKIRGVCMTHQVAEDSLKISYSRTGKKLEFVRKGGEGFTTVLHDEVAVGRITPQPVLEAAEHL